MCFSATASFTTAAATSAVGTMALARAGKPRELPLAGVPVVFGVQQALEGALWLCLQHRWPMDYAPGFANAFVFIALAVWPLLIPVAVGLVETDDARRRLIAMLIPVGLLLAGYSVLSMVRHPFAASVAGRSICYAGEYDHPWAALVVYLLCTCGPLFLSTDRVLRLLGLVVVFGAAVSALAFYSSFVSVWCFFAAASSVAVYFKLAHGRVLHVEVHERPSKVSRP